MPATDPADAARSIARAMPSLMAMAESARLTNLADLIDAAWAEAERIENEAGKT